MSWSSPFIFLLFLLKGQSVDLINARSISSLTGFAVPEIDGSAVDATCRIFFDPTPDTPTERTTNSPITRKQQVATTTKKPAVKPPLKKPQTKDAGVPMRIQPAAARPIPNSQSNAALRILYYLLANRQGQIGRLQMASRSAKSSATWKAGSFSSEDSSDES